MRPLTEEQLKIRAWAEENNAKVRIALSQGPNKVREPSIQDILGELEL